MIRASALFGVVLLNEAKFLYGWSQYRPIGFEVLYRARHQ